MPGRFKLVCSERWRYRYLFVFILLYFVKACNNFTRKTPFSYVKELQQQVSTQSFHLLTWGSCFFRIHSGSDLSLALEGSIARAVHLGFNCSLTVQSYHGVETTCSGCNAKSVFRILYLTLISQRHKHVLSRFSSCHFPAASRPRAYINTNIGIRKPFPRSRNAS